MIKNSENIAFVFPGQGSQFLGMGKDLADNYNVCKVTFQQANEILGFDILKLMWDGPIEELNKTEVTQPALYIHSIAALRLFDSIKPKIKPVFLAGHSLGEICALTAAGCITFESGLDLVRKRGELMKAAGKKNPGGMVAVLGMDVSILDEICKQASSGKEIAQIANDNCPGQIVISGNRSALERASELAKERGARKIRPLAVSIAAHSELMSSAQEGFENAIAKIREFRDAMIPVISNVLAIPLRFSEELKTDILAQLISRVRWTESMQYLISKNVSTFIEIGSGNVLTGLLKRIDAASVGFSLCSVADFEGFSTEMDVSFNK
jgi:[acyl-carrier-protein] S-malonyltransferase